MKQLGAWYYDTYLHSPKYMWLIPSNIRACNCDPFKHQISKNVLKSQSRNTFAVKFLDTIWNRGYILQTFGWKLHWKTRIFYTFANLHATRKKRTDPWNIVGKKRLCVKTTELERQRNPCPPKTTTGQRIWTEYKTITQYKLVILDVHLCCYTTFNLVQNTKIMQKEVGAYINHKAYETGDVWCWINVSRFVTWCHKKLSPDLQFINSPPLKILHI